MFNAVAARMAWGEDAFLRTAVSRLVRVFAHIYIIKINVRSLRKAELLVETPRVPPDNDKRQRKSKFRV